MSVESGREKLANVDEIIKDTGDELNKKESKAQEQIEVTEKNGSKLELVVGGVVGLLEIEKAKKDAGVSYNEDMMLIDPEKLKEELSVYPLFIEYFSSFLDKKLSEERFFELQDKALEEGVSNNIKHFTYFIAHKIGAVSTDAPLQGRVDKIFQEGRDRIKREEKNNTDSGNGGNVPDKT